LIRAIFACDKNWGIGQNGELPWPKNPADLKWFRECTTKSVVVMGRTTWNSNMPKPLPKRINCVVSRSDYRDFKIRPHCVIHPDNLINCLRSLEEKFIDVWVIGGAKLLESSLGIVEEIWLSRISNTYICDTHLPRDLIEMCYTCYSKETINSGLTIEKWRQI